MQLKKCRSATCLKNPLEKVKRKKKTTPTLPKSVPSASAEAGAAVDLASVAVAVLAAVVTEVMALVSTEATAGMDMEVTASEADAPVEPVSGEEWPVERDVTCALT